MKSKLLIIKISQILLLAIFTLIPGRLTFSQVFPERNLIYNPLMNEENSSSGTHFMNSISAFAEFGHYLRKYESHAWNQKIGVYFEFFRTGDHSSLAFLSNIEFIADPNNDINFNPRAIYWEEAIIFTKKANGFFWQAGYTHRCKHDVDNLSYGEERSLIYGSILGKIILPVNFKISTLSSIAAMRVDIFTVKQDYRKPEVDPPAAPSINNLAAAAGINYNLYKNFGESNAGLFMRNYFSASMYSDKDGFFNQFSGINEINFHAAISAGFFFNGKAGLNLGLRYEYQHDTGIKILPLGANLLSLFIAVNNPWDFY